MSALGLQAYYFVGELFADGSGVYVLVCIIMPLIPIISAKVSKGGWASSGTITKRRKTNYFRYSYPDSQPDIPRTEGDYIRSCPMSAVM